MKYSYKSLLLFSACTCFALFSMDQELANLSEDPINIATLAKKISNKINANYSTVPFYLPLYGTSPINHLAIVHTMYDHTSNPSTELIDRIYDKNSVFRQSINHFIQLAEDGIDCISPSTIDGYIDTKKKHPSTSINMLKPKIREYCMDKFLSGISCDLDIRFSGHTDKITWYDVCEKKILLLLQALIKHFDYGILHRQNHYLFFRKLQ